MTNAYPYILASHIIFIVTWFSGLFYIVRLLIYHTEALEKTEPEKSILANQYQIMEKRLMSIITTPSLFLATATGITLLSIQSHFIQESWMQVKLFFVACVIVYHILCLKIQQYLKKGIVKYTSQQLRLFNELASLFLIAIVFLVVLKDLVNMLWGIAVLICVGICLSIAVKVYKNRRNKI